MERCPGGGGALLALPMPLPSRSDEPVARLYLNSPDALGLLGSASSVRSTRGRVKTTESSVESCVTAVGENFKFFSATSRARFGFLFFLTTLVILKSGVRRL